MTSRRSNPVRTVGAGHLALAGAANVATGATVMHPGAVSAGLDPAVRLLVSASGSVAVLRLSGAVTPHVGTLAVLVGTAVAAVGLCQLVGGGFVLTDRPLSRPVALAAVGSVNPLVAPVALVAAVLLSFDAADES